MRTLAVAAACFALSGCMSTNGAIKVMDAYAKASNTLDPDCGKDLAIKTIYMVFPWGTFPVPDVNYHKVCHPEVLSGQPARAPVSVGSVIGAVPGV